MDTDLGRGNLAYLDSERRRPVTATSQWTATDGALHFSDNAMGVELALEDMPKMCRRWSTRATAP